MENTNQPTNLSGKIVELTSTRNLAHNRSLVPLGYVLVLILFAFSLCDFKCNMQRVGSVTGYDLVMGKYVKANPMFTLPNESLKELNNSEYKKLINPIYKTYEDKKGHEITAMHIPSNAWAIVALATTLLGLISYMFAIGYKPHVAVTTGSIGTISMLLLYSSLSNLLNQRFTYLIEADFTPAFWLIAATFTSIAVVGFYRLRYPLPEPEPAAEGEEIEEVGGTPGFEDFFTRYKWGILATLLLSVAGIVFYKFQIKKDYTDDVKDLAKDACNCDIEKNKREKSDFAYFITKGRMAKPEDFSDLDKKFSRLENKIDRNYERCHEAIDKKFEELSLRAVDGENFTSQDELEEKYKDVYEDLRDSLVGDEGSEMKEKAQKMLDSLERAGRMSEYEFLAPPPPPAYDNYNKRND